MSLIKAFSNMVNLMVAKNEEVARTHFGNKAFIALMRRTARMIVQDANLEFYEKYALADAVATLAVYKNNLFDSGGENGFHPWK